MSAAMSSKRRRHESEYSLVTLSAVAAAKSIAESESNGHHPETVKKEAKSSKKRDENQLHPMYGVQPFIAKLYQMINTCDSDSPQIASWDDNGQTFVVKDTKAFASEVMPNYMQTKQFDSFIRNLNFYDFHKIHALPIPKSDRDPGAAKHVKYRHPNFQRGKMDLVREIKRSTRKVRNAAALQEKEVEQLKKHVKKLESTMEALLAKVIRLEDMVRMQAMEGTRMQVGVEAALRNKIISNGTNDNNCSNTSPMPRMITSEAGNPPMPAAPSVHSSLSAGDPFKSGRIDSNHFSGNKRERNGNLIDTPVSSVNIEKTSTVRFF